MEILIPLLPLIINILTEIVKILADKKAPSGSAPAAVAPVSAVVIGTGAGGVVDAMNLMPDLGDGYSTMIGAAIGLCAIAYNQAYRILIRPLVDRWRGRPEQRRPDTGAIHK